MSMHVIKLDTGLLVYLGTQCNKGIHSNTIMRHQHHHHRHNRVRHYSLFSESECVCIWWHRPTGCHLFGTGESSLDPTCSWQAHQGIFWTETGEAPERLIVLLLCSTCSYFFCFLQSDGTVSGCINLSLKWQFAYLPPKASTRTLAQVLSWWYVSLNFYLLNGGWFINRHRPLPKMNQSASTCCQEKRKPSDNSHHLNMPDPHCLGPQPRGVPAPGAQGLW